LASERADESAPPEESLPEEPAESVAPPQTSFATEPAAPEPLPAGSGSSVQKAIEEVNGVVDALRTSLDDMEEVLEMLEMFERQQNLDEQEIESLRRALRQLQRPRDGGHQRR
jgi:TolA-binding protein